MEEWCFVRVLLKSFVKNLLKNRECFIKNIETGSRNNKIKKQGSRLPINAHKKIVSGGSPIANPRGIAPLSSIMGTMAVKKTIK